jgi:4-amino-4-deoxy-L-arabinose transferase-like glycosyltransferase
VHTLKKFVSLHPFASLSLIFLITRLVNLTLLPTFIDESTFIDWGWRTVNIPGLFFFPLSFYKMPLIMWFFGIFQFLFSDPLLAGRLVGVLTGWLAFFGLYRLAKITVDSRTAVISCLLYIFIPIFIFFDRQALMESALMAAGIWSCYFLYLYLEKPGVRLSLWLGITLGLGCLVKANGLIFVPAAFLIIFYTAWKNSRTRYHLLTYAILTLICILLVMSPVLFQETFWITIHNVSDFTMTMRELLGFPVLTWGKSLFAHLEIIFWYFNPLIFASLILSRKKIPVVALWTILTLIFTTLLVKHALPRYLAPYLPPLLIFAADWLSHQKNYLLPLFIAPSLLISALLVFNPPGYFRVLSRLTSYSYIDDYLTGRDTGYQAMATIKYLKDHLPSSQVYVCVAANAGNPEQAVFNYLRRRQDTILGYLDDHVVDIPLDEFDCLSASIPVFYVARHEEQGGLHRFYTKWATITNSENDDYNTIYTLKSDCRGKILSIDNVIRYYQSRI